MNNKHTRPTQAEQLIRYLADHGTITALEAVSDLNIYRLSARIFELKHNYGLNITTSNETRRRSDGSYVTFTRYTLEAEDVRA